LTYINILNSILLGEFETKHALIADNSVDLILTSPPYVDQRKKQYGGTKESEYVEWTVNWMSLIRRMLKPHGSIVINMRPHVRNGRLSPYVRDTLTALCADGWIEHDEWIWRKSDAPPLGRHDWPRRTWEHLFWVGKSRRPYCDATVCGCWSTKLGAASKKGNEQGYINGNSAQYADGLARITDVFEAPVNANHREPWNTHPAQFPEALAERIIQTLCPIGGTVLDPFIGSGTVGCAAIRHRRNFIGVERNPTYVAIANRRIRDRQLNPDSDDYFMWQTTAPANDPEPILPAILAEADEVAGNTVRRGPVPDARLYEAVWAIRERQPSLSLRQIATILAGTGFLTSTGRPLSTSHLIHILSKRII
jgi:site-specific DNA-methyltransferase (adenine-specific)